MSHFSNFYQHEHLADQRTKALTKPTKRATPSIMRLLLAGFFTTFLWFTTVFPASAHQSGSNHLQCDTVVSTSSMIQSNIAFHRATGVGSSYCVNWNDNYTFNGPPPTPLPGCFPGGTHIYPPETPYPVVYKVITTPSQTTYTAVQNTTGSALSCDIVLNCTQTCTPPESSGLCDSNCDIALNSGDACFRYNQSLNWDVTTNAYTTDIFWDDSTTSQVTNSSAPTPAASSVSKSFTYPGTYDILVKCGTQTCHKRYNTVCQTVGSGTPTPSFYPTTTPTPTNSPASCSGGMICSHPCSCDQGSQAYINAGCNNGLIANADYGGGFGSVTGTLEGNACAPGLVCCSPPTGSTQSWIKVKSGSFHDNSTNINSIPANATAFNVSDTGACHPDNPSSLACFNIGASGLVTAEGAIDFGSGSAVNDSLWAYGRQTYSRQVEFTPEAFIAFTSSRKEVVNLSDPSELVADKINLISGNTTIDSSDDTSLSTKTPFVLLVSDGNLTFDMSGIFNSSNNPMVFIVDGTIEFKSDMSTVNGIFIANDFDFAYDISEGDTTSQELLVNGGLVSMQETQCNNKRVRSDVTKPSCFFVFDFVNQYVPVINLISSRTFSRNAN